MVSQFLTYGVICTEYCFALTAYRSFRNTEIGSWYVNALVRVFMEDACKLDVCAMLNKVFCYSILYWCTTACAVL